VSYENAEAALYKPHKAASAEFSLKKTAGANYSTVGRDPCGLGEDSLGAFPGSQLGKAPKI